jgi:UDP-glucose 4-epimerase
VLRLYADTGLAERLLGYRPEVSLRQGLEKLFGWYRRLGRSPEELLAEERVHNWTVAV